MTSPVLTAHDQAVEAAVATISRPVATSRAPAGALAALLAGTGPGYMVVYPRPGGSRDGPVDDPYTDVELIYQVTCVDVGPEGARWMSDRLDAAMADVTVPGRSILWVQPSPASGIWPDDDTADRTLFFSTPTFRIATTPA